MHLFPSASGATLTLFFLMKMQPCIWSEVGKQTFLEVRKSKIRKFLSSFRYQKSVNFLGVPVRKSQIRNFLFSQNTAKLCLKTALKVVFLKRFLDFVKILIRALCAVFVRRKSMYLQTCVSFKSANYKKLGLQIANLQTFTFAEGSQI